MTRLTPPLLGSARDRVGPYHVVRALGAGGSARVDLARIDRAYGFQRLVVLKRPLEHLRAQPAARESLRREASLGGQLRHPHLIGVLDAGEHDGYDYLALEYVDGASLRDLTASGAGRVRDVPRGFALAVVHDAALGLHHAHELRDDQGDLLGLVHRDVAPGNILIGLDGGVKLADFGVAKATHVNTLSGSMHGTVTYMAPEVARGHAYDRRADVFSLGVILYELATGVRPFYADHDVASLHKILAGTFARPRSVKAIAASLEAVILTAMAPSPQDRFPTARALADALVACASEARVVLAARHIAPVVAEILQAAPVVEDARFVDEDTTLTHTQILADTETSLIEVIEALPDDPVPVPAFGSGPELIDLGSEPLFGNATARPVVPRAPGRRPWVVMLVIVCLLVPVGVVAGILLARRDPTVPPPVAEPSVPAVVPVDAVELDAMELDAMEIEAVEINVVEADAAESGELDAGGTAESDDPDRPRTRPSRGRPSTTPDAAPLDASVPPPIDAPKKPVQWDPTMLLPTDERASKP